ncbi:MAG TPA: outer membrane lipoprotein-sorting protein [Pyrinomonadaceae bacterium]|nr:outer membrane lipoprotein-sorting protein [Pyrinomonadaceae bacterium]
MRRLGLIVCLLLLAAPLVQANKITSGEQLIAAMRQKYARRWYKTTTFRQVTTDYEADGNKKVAVWYEALAMPGRLRIDFDPMKDGNGILFVADKIYAMKAGKVDSSRPLIHPLLLLAFDVYFLPVDETLAKLKQLKFDLSLLREDTWQGRPVYVVGARSGDTHSPQFWIDKERLYFVRMFRPAGKDGTLTSEIQFNKYERLGGGWVSPEVIFMIDGKTTTTESYSEIRANVKLDEELFNPEKWATAQHWRKD